MNCINMWEEVTESTYRMKVPGGWIVLHTNSLAITNGYERNTSISESMCFVTDPNWDWERWNTIPEDTK